MVNSSLNFFVDYVIKTSHMPMVSRCSCCMNSSEETREHLFYKGELGLVIWQYFKSVVDMLDHRFINIEVILKQWHSKASFKSMQGFVYCIAPMIILWEIWKERYQRRY